jgi:orotidine-5'-phosphate decarboxylase
MKENPIIIALDTNSSLKAMTIVKKLKVSGVAFKIGFELFTSCGPKIVDKIIGHDVRVFLDLKFHDIPNTVKSAAREVTKMGVWMFNVHSMGGAEMMKGAKEVSLEEASKLNIASPLVTAVTVLTSHHDLTPINIAKPINDQVRSLGKLTYESGLDGVVCSAQEASLIRKDCGEDFTIVTPGIRPKNSMNHDQKRVVDPKEAYELGSNYLVIGRPIFESKRPIKVINDILESIKSEG